MAFFVAVVRSWNRLMSKSGIDGQLKDMLNAEKPSVVRVLNLPKVRAPKEEGTAWQ